MTANLAFKAVREGKLSGRTPVVMTAHAASTAPSKLGLKPGSGLFLDDALRIMLTRSMNDVATAIGENLSGSETAFVGEMNAEAARLGMKGTHFENASGLPDPAQVTTAEDLAILALHIIKSYPERLPLFSIPTLSVSGRTLKNTNGLIGTFAGAEGMKTGYICSSGFNLVSMAKRNGRRLVAIVLGAPNARLREKAAGRMLEYGFAHAGTGKGALHSEADAPRQATDLSGWNCGKTYPGFTPDLNVSTAIATSQKPAASPGHPSEQAAEPMKARVRRF
jgi:D-alanyl-D-alanine carboxypeptidase